MGSFPHPRNGIVKLDFEYILLFKKQGNAPKPTQEQKENAKMTNKEWNTYFNGHWNFAGAKQDRHLAMFPEELPHRLIKMFSFPNETILDPFMGSGTTALATRNLNQNSVGYEINPDFIPIIKERIGTNDAFTNVDLEIIKQKDISTNFEQKIQELPYIFTDTHKLDKKIDVKKIQYGSKIDANSTGKREEFYSVKEIISTELIRLSNNLIIRLIGIKQNPKINGEATEFLTKKLHRKKVFLKYDEIKHDNENNLMAYLYLKNKTFVNAHLLKEKLALIDNSIDFKYKNKFNKLNNSESIRLCSPTTIEEWQSYYFENVRSREHIEELGKKLYVKITECIQSEVESITEEDCVNYMVQLVIDRTFDGYQTEIKTIYGQLQQLLGIKIEPAPDVWDRLYNVDFFIKINEKHIGLQIKPINKGVQLPEIHKEYALQEKTRQKFTEKFGGKVWRKCFLHFLRKKWR